jgi:hypothetical protein
VSMELGFRRQANECLMHALARYAEHERLHKRRHSDRSGTARILAALKKLEGQNALATPASASDVTDAVSNASEPRLSLDALSQQQTAQQSSNGERPN